MSELKQLREDNKQLRSWIWTITNHVSAARFHLQEWREQDSWHRDDGLVKVALRELEECPKVAGLSGGINV